MPLGEWFINGGMFMYFVLTADILAIVVSIVFLAVVTRANYKIFLIMAIIFGLIPALLGGAGYLIGHQQIMVALANVTPADRQELYKASISVARIPAIFGGISTVVLLLVGVSGLKLRKP